MLSTICSAKQKRLQMCAELRHCQRWVTNRQRQRVPQWRTRDGKTSVSYNLLSYLQHQGRWSRKTVTVKQTPGRTYIQGHGLHRSTQPNPNHDHDPNYIPTPITKTPIQPDPAYHQNATVTSVARVSPFHRISWKMVEYSFLRYPANKQTNKLMAMKI